MTDSACSKNCQWQEGYRKGYYAAMVEVCNQRQERLHVEEKLRMYVVMRDVYIEGIFSTIEGAAEHYNKIDAPSRTIVGCEVDVLSCAGLDRGEEAK